VDDADSVFPDKWLERKVQLVKAMGMSEIKDLTHCEDCEPLVVGPRKKVVFCQCSLHRHFIKPWRCIPCVLAEEASLIASQQKYAVSYNPQARWPEDVYEKVVIPHVLPPMWMLMCNSRKCSADVANAPATTLSRHADGVERRIPWCGCRGLLEVYLIQEQLQGVTDLNRRVDPSLGQLGRVITIFVLVEAV